MNLHTALC